MTANVVAHDLLKISSAGVSALRDLANFSSLPLEDFPFVVVRRADPKGGLVPVGIRGMERNERCAGWLNPNDILASIRPESIEPRTHLPNLPAFDAFLELKRQWRDLGMTWGPSGSVGFELASGCRVVREESDLDLVIRAAAPLSPARLQMLAEIGEGIPCQIDIQVETVHGAFSPKEYMSASRECLLRTICGPRLVEDPWLRLST